jgi:hypothetical protein
MVFYLAEVMRISKGSMLPFADKGIKGFFLMFAG